MGWANGATWYLLGSNALLLVILILASTDLPEEDSSVFGEKYVCEGCADSVP